MINPTKEPASTATLNWSVPRSFNNNHPKRRKQQKLHGHKTNINHFALLFESDDEEIPKQREKTKTPIIVLREDDKGIKKVE